MSKPTYSGGDDQQLVKIRADFSGGVNTRNQAAGLQDNQGQEVTYYDIGVPGEVKKIKGTT